MTAKSRPRNMLEFSTATGLSRPTVSKYFNDPQSVRPSTRAKIEQFMAELDYRPNFFALNQNRRASKTIGIIVPDLLDPFFTEIVRRIEARGLEAGYWPFLLSSHGSAELEVRAIDTLRSLKVAGAIIAPLGDASDREHLERLAGEVPIVLIDTWLPGSFAFVGTDNTKSIGQMVAYLCATGTPPCFFAFPEFSSTSRERREAYEKAVTGAGHEPKVIVPSENSWEFERLGYNGTMEVLATGGFPTSTVLCANDRLAIGVLAAVYSAGLRIGPGLDLRVAGHDDHPHSQFTCPALTTVAQDYARLSEASFDMLLDIVEERDSGLRSYRMPSTIIRRASA